MFGFNYLKQYNNKQNDLISIIVPIYNTEKKVAMTINSILNQTHKNFELILIDDCSKDNSYEICKKYAKKDNRIKLFRNEINSGVSKTRNVGLSMAKGKYIGFVDSDDYIEKNMYEEVLKTIKINDSDIAQCSTFGFHETKLENNSDRKYFKGNKEVFQAFLDFNYFENMIWDKLFKRSTIGNIRFKEDWNTCEDSFFVTEIMNKVDSAGIVSKSLYHYIKNPKNGLSNNYNFEWMKKCVEVNNYKEKIIKAKYPDLINNFYEFKLCEFSDYIFFNLASKCKIDEKDDKNFKLDFLMETKSFFERTIDTVKKSKKYYYNHNLELLKKEIKQYVNKNIEFYKSINDDEYVKILEKYLYVFNYIEL